MGKCSKTLGASRVAAAWRKSFVAGLRKKNEQGAVPVTHRPFQEQVRLRPDRNHSHICHGKILAVIEDQAHGYNVG